MPPLRRASYVICALFVTSTFLPRPSPAQPLDADRNGALVLTYNVNPEYVD